MLETISTAVNQALESQSEFVPATSAPAAPPVPPSDDVPGPMEQMAAELDALKAERIRERAEHEAALAEAKSRRILSDAMQPPTSTVGRGQLNAKIAAAIREVGNCRWHAMTPQARCEAAGIFGSEKVADKELGTYFGANTSAAAAQLHKADSGRYAYLYAVARCRGILG